MAERLEDFRAKVKALREEWLCIFLQQTPEKRQVRPLSAGYRTPVGAFRRPILTALVELGGRARLDEVLHLVEEKMRDVLNEYDRQPLPSKPQEIRWRNTAQWCRYYLVKEGLLKGDSPPGIWEISDLCRVALQKRDV